MNGAVTFTYFDVHREPERSGRTRTWPSRGRGVRRTLNRTTRRLVAIEVWNASTRLPASLLEALTTRTRPSSFPPLREDDDIAPVRARPLD